MTPFTTLRARAAPLPAADIDTDVIFPARFLLRTEKVGLGDCAFHDWRFDATGAERPGFVLNDARWRGAGVLVAGANFGCGSSREQAPWALLDLGVRCIVAPGFGEIFHANCLSNGILPVTLGADAHAAVMARAESAQDLEVDLVRREIRWTGAVAVPFEIDEARRQGLLNGWDDIDLVRRQHGAAIEAFALRQAALQPWLQPAAGA